MALATAFAGQLARPHGAAGRFVGLAMDLANRKPTRLALDLLSPRAGEHILDVGCGTGSALVALRRRAAARVTGVDPSDLMARMVVAILVPANQPGSNRLS